MKLKKKIKKLARKKGKIDAINEITKNIKSGEFTAEMKKKIGKKMMESKTLIGKQKRLDANKDGKISGKNYSGTALQIKMLKKKKTLMGKGK